MSRPYSRREIANWAIDQLANKVSPSKLAKQLAALMVDSGRAKETELLISDIASELELRGELAQLKITSATKLSAELARMLSSYVKQTTKVKTVSISQEIDPSLLGGFRLETATRRWDRSVAKQLADIKGGL